MSDLAPDPEPLVSPAPIIRAGSAQRQSVGIFGAKGFVGRHLIRRLAAADCHVVAFGRAFPLNYSDLVGVDVELREIDFADVIGTQAKIQDLSVVVQLINSSSPTLGNKHIGADFRANVAPHIEFIESCAMSNVKKFIFISSGGTVYGNPQSLPITEQHPTTPMNSYGLTKLIVEHYVRIIATQYGMNYINLRVANPFGPGQVVNKGQGLIASIIQRHISKLPVMIYGDGSSKRDYLYIDDVTDAILAAIMSDCVDATLNIGSGVGRSILEVVQALEHCFSEVIEVNFMPGRATDAHSNVLDPYQAELLLQWTRKTSFSDGLRKTVDASSYSQSRS